MIIDPNPRDLLYGKQAQAKLIAGANAVANAVKVTLGPRGRNVIIDQTPRRGIRVTKDGVSVAKEINPVDIAENTGAQMFKKAAVNTVNNAGDGTTTATVVAQHLLNKGFELTDKGINPVILGKGMEKALAGALEYIKSNAVAVKDLETIKKVAYISCNNDQELGNVVADTLHKVTEEGAVVIEESKTTSTFATTVSGMQFETGIGTTSRYFVTDADKMEWVKEDCIVLVCDNTISTLNQITHTINKAKQVNKPLLVIAKDFEDRVLQNIVQWYLRGQVDCCLVQAPGFSDLRRARLLDIAAYTGGEVFAENKGIKLTDENAINQCGIATKVVVRENQLIILGGGATLVNDKNFPLHLEEANKYAAYVESLRAEIADTDNPTNEFDHKKKEERLATLTGGTAVIYVGGFTAEEVGEKKDRVDDAVHAVKCAMKKGIVSGGGTVLFGASIALSEMYAKETNKEEKAGIKLVIDALRAPFTTILSNAGYSDIVKASKTVADSILEGHHTFGIDASDGTPVVDMIKAGIVDPALVSMTAIESAVHIAKLMLTTECLVNYHVTKDNWNAIYDQGA